MLLTAVTVSPCERKLFLFAPQCVETFVAQWWWKEQDFYFVTVTDMDVETVCVH